MNKKGMTLVELITSLVLISLVLIFMLNLLATVQNYSVQNQTKSDLLINQAVIVKAIEKDINELGLVGVSICTPEDFEKERKYSVLPACPSNNPSCYRDEEYMKNLNLYCLKLTFNNDDLDDNEGFLLQYTYDYSDKINDDGEHEISKKNVVGYKRGNNQNIRESSISMNPNNYKGTVTSSCKDKVSSNCSLKITMPILDEDGNNYDIVATYIYSSDNFVINSTTDDSLGFTINYDDPNLSKSTFLTGLAVNNKMKSLAGDAIRNDVVIEDNNISAIKRSNTLKANLSSNNIVSTINSRYPIYMWYENNTIYYYTEEERPLLNSRPQAMFSLINNLSDISGLSSVDTSNVTDMDSMFYGDISLSDLSALESWNTSNVTNMRVMFLDCVSLENLDGLENWDVSKVENMLAMFSINPDTYSNGLESKLASIEALSDWQTPRLTDMALMFYNNVSLTTLEGLNKWDVSKVTNMQYLFASMQPPKKTSKRSSLWNIAALENWNTQSVTDITGLFLHAESLENIQPLENWNVSNVTTMSSLFAHSTISNISYLQNWDVRNVEYMSALFSQCSNITDISALSNWAEKTKTGKLKDIGTMFQNVQMTSLEPLRNWDVSNVTNMAYLFGGSSTKQFDTLEPLENWQVGNVKYMQGMFGKISKVETLTGLENWNVSNVEDMGGMFENASSLKNLDAISGWNVAKVTNFGFPSGASGSNKIGMFSGCTALEDASGINGWSINRNANFNNMFYDTPVYPDFTKVTGTWNNEGTFVPN